MKTIKLDGIKEVENVMFSAPSEDIVTAEFEFRTTRNGRPANDKWIFMVVPMGDKDAIVAVEAGEFKSLVRKAGLKKVDKVNSEDLLISVTTNDRGRRELSFATKN